MADTLSDRLTAAAYWITGLDTPPRPEPSAWSDVEWCNYWRSQRHECAMAAAEAATELDRREARLTALEQALEAFAERDCYYGDNCPTFGTRHGTCDGCRARQSLAALKG